MDFSAILSNVYCVHIHGFKLSNNYNLPLRARSHLKSSLSLGYQQKGNVYYGMTIGFNTYQKEATFWSIEAYGQAAGILQYAFNYIFAGITMYTRSVEKISKICK